MSDGDIVPYTETVKDKTTGEEVKVEKTGPVVRDNEKNLKLLADSWRMAQEIDKAIPVLEKAAKLSKDGKSYVLLGNLYLAEDKLEEAVSSIKKARRSGCGPTCRRDGRRPASPCWPDRSGYGTWTR